MFSSTMPVSWLFQVNNDRFFFITYSISFCIQVFCYLLAHLIFILVYLNLLTNTDFFILDEATKDGFDCQMQVNHLSHFLLTKELFPLLVKRAESKGEARIVNHSSIAAWNPPNRLGQRYLEKNGGSLSVRSLSFILLLVTKMMMMICVCECYRQSRWKLERIFPILWS